MDPRARLGLGIHIRNQCQVWAFQVKIFLVLQFQVSHHKWALHTLLLVHKTVHLALDLDQDLDQGLDPDLDKRTLMHCKRLLILWKKRVCKKILGIYSCWL